MDEKDDCHEIGENIMFGQLAPMGTGGFNVALDIDMLKDAIVDHRLPVQNMLVAHADDRMTPGQVTMTPYDSNLPAWSESNFKGESAAFSPLAVNGGNDPPISCSFHIDRVHWVLEACRLLVLGTAQARQTHIRLRCPMFHSLCMWVLPHHLAEHHCFTIGAEGPHPLPTHRLHLHSTSHRWVTRQ